MALYNAKSRRRKAARQSDPKLRPGSSFCKCSACGEYFKSERAFDRHRIGEFGVDRGCAPTARMPEIGLQLDANGVWHFPKRAFSVDRRRDLDVRIGRIEVAA